MLNELPIEINYLIWDNLSGKKLVVLGLVDRESYLHLLHPVESMKLFYKNLTKRSLSKIKFDVKLNQIFHSPSYKRLGIKLNIKSFSDLYACEFKYVDKQNLDKLCEILKDNNNDVLTNRGIKESAFVSPNMYGYVRFQNSSQPNTQKSRYKIFLRGEKESITLCTYSEPFMLILKNRFYIYQDIYLSGSHIWFQSFCYENIPKPQIINYITRNDSTRKAFWFITDTNEYHIIGMSTTSDKGDREETNIDIYLINRELLGENLMDWSNIDLDNLNCYRMPMLVGHPQYMYSISNDDESKIYILVTFNECFAISVFDINTKSFLNSITVHEIVSYAYEKLTFNIINNEYLVVIGRNINIFVHWIDIRNGRLTLDAITKYKSDYVCGMTIFPDGILVKRCDKFPEDSLETFTYNFY